jgi:hypothetical protein
MNPVVHFEMPYEDRARMADFYSKTFGWKAQMLGPEMGEYAVVHTGETDENQMLQKPGMINGGLFKKTSDNQHPSIVIAVDDIRASIQKVKDAGGTIIDMETPGEPMEIPGIGLYIGFIDTEGNRVSMLQPSSQM